jgi:hypothetical protein
MSLLDCVRCVGNLISGNIACEACASGADILLCPTCIKKAIDSYRSCVQCAGVSLERLLQSLGIGRKNVACKQSASQKVQGAVGLCCSAVQQGALIPPAAGTTLPVYVAGSLASYCASHPGDCAQVTSASGKCGTCAIVGSKSSKHPGKPVLRYIPGGPGCPSSQFSCCVQNCGTTGTVCSL